MVISVENGGSIYAVRFVLPVRNKVISHATARDIFYRTLDGARI